MKRLKAILNDVDHKYIREDGKVAITSSSGILDNYSESFNPEKALDNMKITNKLQRAYTKCEWAVARERGKYLHELGELYIKGELKGQDFVDGGISVPEEMELIREYVDSIDRDEWEIFAEHTTYYDMGEEFVGGQLDMLLKSKTRDNVFRIDDFKFTRKLDNKAYNKKFYEPLSTLACSKQNKYFLQNSMYRLMILQEFPEATFEDGFLVHIAPRKTNPFNGESIAPKKTMIQCKDMTKQAQSLLDDYKDNVISQKQS